ncbi:MAG TPA: TetR/AcrR family transcriptional regulator [Spirochaetota bacterium]|nr:TetR/AcrR family transcriptional regulator [Spirochaetota bacterium]HPG49066.1 TetR/AcrR family transcriptional regulator [Spirochaetota bacterium]HPN11881.1 TetR/AcrR family transcriptional regulator [Spirochaetota bacterium]
METVSTGDKIIKAAQREFAQYGFEGARVDRIAQKARINKAMIYYHFKSKENLYETLLSKVYTSIFPRITENIPENIGPKEKLELIISTFIDFIKDLDEDFIRMMLRELSSGGKYFKKLMLPKVIVPMVGVVQDLFDQGVRQGIFKRVVPHFSFIQTLGAIIFTNAIRIILSDTDIGKALFKDDFFDEFKKNLLTIVETGILVE